MIETSAADMRFVYDDDDTLWQKMRGGGHEDLRRRRRHAPTPRCAPRSQRLQDAGLRPLPVCVAKTQYSFSTDPLRAARRAATCSTSARCGWRPGAEFVVMICGDIMTMPGLPKVPSRRRIDVDDDGRIVGLF